MILLCLLPACTAAGSGSCPYQLRDEATGEVREVAAFPPVVRQRGDIAPSDDPAASFSVVLEHPSDYSYVKTLIVPPCRESEARRILAQRH